MLAAMADDRLRATQAQWCDVLGMAVTGNAAYRRRLQMTLREQHGQAVVRLAEVPGLGLDSAQKRIAELGPAAPVDAPDSRSGRPFGGEGPRHHF
jgi:hypothetical protein